MLFLPCILFGLCADIQIIVTTYEYEPIAFTRMPHKWTKGLMLGLGVSTFLMSILCLILILLAFGGVHSNLKLYVFISIAVKAFTWSPFLGMELYDTVFEQIYHDVKFQLNVIKPGNSRETSPTNGK